VTKELEKRDKCKSKYEALENKNNLSYIQERGPQKKSLSLSALASLTNTYLKIADNTSTKLKLRYNTFF